MSFASLLSRKLETIEAPKLPPAGTYLGIITKHPDTRTMTSKKDGNTYTSLDFQCALVEPVLVDDDQLSEFGSVRNVPFRVNFMFAEAEDDESARRNAATEFRLKNFGIHCGADGETVSELLANMVNQTFLVELNHRPDENDPTRVYLNVVKTMSQNG